MIPFKLFLVAFSIGFLDISAQFFARNYYENKKKYYLFVISFLLYFPAIVLMVYAYNYASLALLNSIWDGVSIILGILISAYYFNEIPTNTEILGMLLVVLGGLIIGISSDGGKNKEEIL